jgi:5-methylcytosine-specific restriction endonuclease McrA
MIEDNVRRMNACLSKIFSKSCLLKIYYGSPCQHGHGKMRYVSNNLCVECRKNQFNKWRKENPEKMKAAKLGWYEENKERSSEKSREWQKQNPDRHKKNKKRWVDNNKDKKAAHDKTYAKKNANKLSEYKKNWQKENSERLKILAKKKYEKNKEAYFCYAHNRRARKKGNGGKHTHEQAMALLESQNHNCINCQEKLTETNRHKDHIMPLLLGGTNNITNIQWLCASCNLSKGAKDPIVWAQKMGRLL